MNKRKKALPMAIGAQCSGGKIEGSGQAASGDVGFQAPDEAGFQYVEDDDFAMCDHVRERSNKTGDESGSREPDGGAR